MSDEEKKVMLKKVEELFKSGTLNDNYDGAIKSAMTSAIMDLTLQIGEVM